MRVEVHNQDAVEFLAGVHDETVDVIITDPPYWTLDKWRNVGTTTRLGGHRKKEEQRDEMWFETIDQAYLWDLFLGLDRVLKLDGHLYIFCDDKVGAILMNWVQEAQGDHAFGDAHLLVWDKVNMGMGYHYRRCYDFILFAWRTKREGVKGFTPRRLRDLGMHDVLRGMPRIAQSKKQGADTYPTEKPPALIQTLVMQSAREGDTLLDPMAGSGVLAVATPFDLKATVLLNDKSPAAIEHMRKRFGGDLKNPPLVDFGVPVKWFDDVRNGIGQNR